MSDFISEKQIVSIREFLENYCSLRCSWRGKMTHKRMTEFLSLKGRHVIRGKIGEITKEEKLTGKFIYVKDEIGKIIPYKNPNMELEKLHINLLINSNPEKLRQRRLKNLQEENLTYDDYGRVVTLEEYNEICRLKLLREKEEQLRKLEEQQGKEDDEVFAYYEKMATRNRNTKVKTYYIARKGKNIC